MTQQYGFNDQDNSRQSYHSTQDGQSEEFGQRQTVRQGFANAHIIGNVGKDPEKKTFTDANGNEIVKGLFSLAINERDHTEWYDIITKDQNCKYALNSIRSGDNITVIGKLRIKQWETRDNETGMIIKNKKPSIFATTIIKHYSKKRYNDNTSGNTEYNNNTNENSFESNSENSFESNSENHSDSEEKTLPFKF